MNTKNILVLGGLGLIGYYAYRRFFRPQRFFLLPDGTRIPVAQAEAVLPTLGYIKTAYGWIHTSVLRQLQQQSGNSGASFSDFLRVIPNIWTSVQDFIGILRDTFGNDVNINELILGDPSGGFSDFV